MLTIGRYLFIILTASFCTWTACNSQSNETDAAPQPDGPAPSFDSSVLNDAGSPDATCDPVEPDDLDAGSEGDGGAGSCPEYPVVWPDHPRDGGEYFCYFDTCADLDAGVIPDAGSDALNPPSYITPAQVAAIAELRNFDPSADPKKLFWNDVTDTLASVEVHIPLPNCTADGFVDDLVIPMLDAHPALFQLNTAEWESPHLRCDAVPDVEVDTDLGLNVAAPVLHRTILANHVVNHDLFSYAVTRIQGVVTLINLGSATGYLPNVAEQDKNDVDQAMTGCNNITRSQIKAKLQNTTFTVQVIDILTGEVQGISHYRPNANDAFLLDPQINQVGTPPIYLPSETWSWRIDFSAPDSPQVLLSNRRTVRILVNSCNYFPDLVNSDAHCAAPDVVGAASPIGFDIEFDTHTGELLGVRNGFANCGVIQPVVPYVFDQFAWSR
jgi:hypothetical protein